MAEIEKFNIDFVKRTIKILDHYNGDYSFSNLINCTLGLIILPYEARGSSSIFNKNIAVIDSLPSFTLINFNPIKVIKNNEVFYYPKSLKVLLQKIRNGLAHQNIRPVNFDGILKSIVISNKYRSKQDLEIEFTEYELKNFALFISETYLHEYND